MALVLRLCGGGPNQPMAEIDVVPGGITNQCILKDMRLASAWDFEHSIMSIVQILKPELFEAVIGKAPPKSPFSAKT